MAINSIFRRFKERTLNEFAIDISYNILKNLLGFRALRGMTLHPNDVNPSYELARTDFPGARVFRAELLRDLNPERGISQEFIDEAIKKGDWCFGFYDKDKLISYGWYSENPTKIDQKRILHFSSDYIYMDKGFTHEDYRGARLHGFGMAAAAKIASELGKEGLISYVEANNVRSLRSCRKLGYKIFGTIFMCCLFGHWFTFRSGGCRRFDFYVEVVR